MGNSPGGEDPHQQQLHSTYGTMMCTCFGSTSKFSHRRRLSVSRNPPHNLSASLATFEASKRAMGGIVEGEPSLDSSYVFCPQCGRVQETTTASADQLPGGLSLVSGGSSPGQRRLSKWLDSTRRPRIEAPRHTNELLEANPQYWTASLSSKDTLGGNGGPARNAFEAFLKQTFPNKGSAKDSICLLYTSPSPRD